jgi:dihydrolipoamide dehydrogenase
MALKTQYSADNTALKTRNIVVATGSSVVQLLFRPTMARNSCPAITLPQSLPLIDVSAIGLDFGSEWARLESKVTIMEF